MFTLTPERWTDRDPSPRIVPRDDSRSLPIEDRPGTRRPVLTEWDS